jgi:geranylgeranyl diphosphate synthase, type II
MPSVLTAGISERHFRSEGDADEVGKEIGGDIRERKKTFLFVAALGRSRGADRAFLRSLHRRNGMTDNVIDRVRDIYRRTGALAAATGAIRQATMRAQESLDPIRPGKGKDMLLWLLYRLLDRAS